MLDAAWKLDVGGSLNALSEVSQINNTIASEVQRVKDLLTSLSNRKTAVLQMYGAACEVLGEENDLAEESIEIEF